MFSDSSSLLCQVPLLSPDPKPDSILLHKYTFYKLFTASNTFLIPVNREERSLAGLLTALALLLYIL